MEHNKTWIKLTVAASLSALIFASCAPRRALARKAVVRPGVAAAIAAKGSVANASLNNNARYHRHGVTRHLSHN